MKKALQFLSVFVPISLAFAAFIYGCIYYSEFMLLGLLVGVSAIFLTIISAAIAGSIYADKELKKDDTYLW